MAVLENEVIEIGAGVVVVVVVLLVIVVEVVFVINGVEINCCCATIALFVFGFLGADITGLAPYDKSNG